MVLIIYTKHLKSRLKSRRIPEDYPNIILKASELRFFDNIEKRNISIKKLKYNGKLRNMMIAYERNSDIVSIVTIHPITENQIVNRIKSMRWEKNEKI